ncbi:MAG: hypothetical protein M3O15_14165 [Acidobacteriota bacterium]|nr:hypothetical protein [Acidobacteriota bacterium]
MEELRDEELLTAFEAGTLPEGLFHHREHVRLAWVYLRRLPLLAALGRFSEGLKRLAVAYAKAGLYHETITWAYLLLIHERMARSGPGEAWEEFAARNPDLLCRNSSVLSSYYRDETLASELARRIFVLPDRAAGEP